MQETQVQFLGWEDPLEKNMATHCSILAWKRSWVGYSPWGCRESDMTEGLNSNKPTHRIFSPTLTVWETKAFVWDSEEQRAAPGDTTSGWEHFRSGQRLPAQSHAAPARDPDPAPALCPPRPVALPLSCCLLSVCCAPGTPMQVSSLSTKTHPHESSEIPPCWPVCQGQDVYDKTDLLTSDTRSMIWWLYRMSTWNRRNFIWLDEGKECF